MGRILQHLCGSVLHFDHLRHSAVRTHLSPQQLLPDAQHAVGGSTGSSTGQHCAVGHRRTAASATVMHVVPQQTGVSPPQHEGGGGGAAQQLLSVGHSDTAASAVVMHPLPQHTGFSGGQHSPCGGPVGQQSAAPGPKVAQSMRAASLAVRHRPHAHTSSSNVQHWSEATRSSTPSTARRGLA